MDRQHRQDLKHDKFVDELGALSMKARDNQRVLYMIAGVALAIALIAYGIYFYRSSQESKAQALLATAIDTMESPIAEGQPGQPPQPNAKFKNDAERTAAAEKQFKQVEDQYSGSDAADVAGLYLARITAGRGDVAGAEKRLKAFIDDHPKNVLVGTARYSLYQLRAESGDAANVITELNAELAKSEPVLPADSLLVLLAHAYDAQGNSDKARETYRRITSEYPDSPFMVEAQRRVGTV